MSVEALTALYSDGTADRLRARLAALPEEQRVVSYERALIVLAYLANRYRPRRGYGCYVDESREQIAAATGLTPRTVTRALQALDAAGVTATVVKARRGRAPRRTIPLLDAERCPPEWTPLEPERCPVGDERCPPGWSPPPVFPRNGQDTTNDGHRHDDAERSNRAFWNQLVALEHDSTIPALSKKQRAGLANAAVYAKVTVADFEIAALEAAAMSGSADAFHREVLDLIDVPLHERDEALQRQDGWAENDARRKL